MPLRQKVLIISAFIFILLIVLFFAISQAIILRSYARLETREMRQQVDRVMRALQQELESLDTITYDWAAWDDTYEFIVDHNADYVEANLGDDTWFVLETNVVLYVDEHGTIVFGRGIDLIEQAEVPLPSSLLDQLDQGPLLAHEDTSSRVAGWLNLPEGLLMVTSRPIITTNNEGPIRGALIFGRFVTAERIEALSELVQVDVSFLASDDPLLPADFHPAQMTSPGKNSIFTQARGNDLFTGYAVLRDIYGQPAQVVRAEMPRSIYRQGVSNVYYLFASIGLVTLIFVGMMLFLLERIVLARLHNMGDTIRQIRTSNDISLRVSFSGNDEITQLGSGFNNLLDTLAQTHYALENARDELEIRVQERTAQLEESNRQLQDEIAERKRAQQAAIAARDQTLEALRVKTQILANVSHDARTPLGVIVLRTQLLQKRLAAALGDKEQEMFDSILTNAFQLTRFVDNLLGEAQANANKITLNYTQFRPVDLLDEITSVMSPVAEQKGLSITAEVGSRVPPVLTGDVEHLKQILINLSDNAIKFTEQGSVTMRIDCPDETHWTLQVADTGIGIPAEAQKHIFEAFYQADGTITRNINRGVGLGLSIVQGLATLMNATIEVQSEPGHGTTFTLAFPLQPQLVKDRHEQ